MAHGSHPSIRVRVRLLRDERQLQLGLGFIFWVTVCGKFSEKKKLSQNNDYQP